MGGELVSSLIRRIVPVLLIVLLAAWFAPEPAAAARKATKAEAHLLSLINDARRARGQVRLLWDVRLADVAQARSDDMAKNSYFAHLPKGELPAMLEKKGIEQYRWSEVLAWNKRAKIMKSAEQAFASWRSSDLHWRMLMDKGFNYIALGVAQGRDGRYIWTGLLIKRPDLTPPKASIVSTKLTKASGGKRTVKVTWTGRDVKLSVLTSGLRDYRLQMKVGKKSWQTVTPWSTYTYGRLSLDVGKTYKFRVRARDNAGNRSSWSAAVTVKP
jgi:uncharacterized protein YkwD